MKEPITTAIIFRGIPKPLWRRVKATAATRGETVKAAVLRFFENYTK